MKKAIITGSHGTIGSVLSKILQERNIEVIPWNRREVAIDDYHAMESFVKSRKPDVLFHLAYASDTSLSSEITWKVNYEWTSELAWITKELNVKFLFTSTNLVFGNSMQGPYTLSSISNADHGYGFEKRKAEVRVFNQHPHAIITRLGWQIGSAAGSNNMIDFLERKMREEGEVRLSVNWKPACSFLEDTCEKLVEIVDSYEPGLYMIDSNERWNIYEIATALNELHRDRWKIVRTEDPATDTRMIDSKVNMPSLKERLDLPL